MEKARPEFQVVTLTPPGLTDPSIAIAGSRAGAAGVLDLEYARDERAATAAIQRLARLGRGLCGVKLDPTALPLAGHLLSELPEPIQIVILTRAAPERLKECLRLIRNTPGRQAWLEVTNLEGARLGEELGFQALVAKGNEAGGRVGDETSFILLQRLLPRVKLPVYVQGGIGLHTAAACYAAGAAGCVLDLQLALTRESPLSEEAREIVVRLDGSETILLPDPAGEIYRVYSRPGLGSVGQVGQAARAQADAAAGGGALRQAVRERAGWGNPGEDLWLAGQDIAFAGSLARRFHTVGGVVAALKEAVASQVQAAKGRKPLAASSPLAQAHGTRYPVVQGPMTRVSDRAAFAAQVAEGGGLPFIALALMRAPEAEALLVETRAALAGKPWGVGILGFVPYDLRQEQMEVIRKVQPSFALIAGGRPDQALSLEKAGIPTYLHIPSPGLLRLFLESGSRRFIFEGRECGGHVGPRSSFVLWNTMIDTLLEELPGERLAECQVLFAGGIHDDLSAAMVAALAAPLAERGAKIGVLLGTAYLFTKEAVETQAIVAGFQEEALRCSETVLLESGPGHAIRCARTPFVDRFEQEKRRLQTAGLPPEEIRAELEALNLGRLRIASKGITRDQEQEAQSRRYVALEDGEQHAQGMYMIGQLAALRDATCTIESLHRDVTVRAMERLATLPEPDARGQADQPAEQPSDVAIIGMACILPKAPDLKTYWENILAGVDAITEIPRDRWDWERYFDPDRKAPDKIYSRWGGFLDEVPFDPVSYGMPPSSLPSIEPLQLLMLEAVRSALKDAGYAERPFPRHRTSVIVGAGGGVADLGERYALRAGLPMILDEVPPELLSQLPEWTEDSFPGILINVVAGRVANRFDLGGVNYTVDAACASSLAAVYLAVRELEAGTSDMVIAAGGDTVQNPFGYLCFSKTQALSPTGRCRTFDEEADGIAISEGIAVLVLKRLADAERDGDRIYAVIKAVAGSSDGRDKGLTAPRPEGQIQALKRAYAKAGFSPATVGLIEAHGTGTVAGDQAEIEALKRVFASAGVGRQECAVGSVKSMIGHTKCTAGIAGLIKIALAAHYKVLPPTLNVKQPNRKARFSESPFYVNTEPRPWFLPPGVEARRAGVSAFGFGGTNFHAVVEEYTGHAVEAQGPASGRWPAHLCLWTGGSAGELVARIEPVLRALTQPGGLRLEDLAYSLWKAVKEEARPGGLRLAIVAESLADLRQKLEGARQALEAGRLSVSDPRGIYLSDAGSALGGKVAFLFPGQGSQYLQMMGDLAIQFAEVREQFEKADRVLYERLGGRLSAYVFPPPQFTPEEESSRKQALTQTHIAQAALGAASLGLYHLLQNLGLSMDMAAGHSYGEYVALYSAGVFDEETLYRLSEARGRAILESAGEDLGTMAAVMESQERILPLLEAEPDVWIANINAPRQVVISGTQQGIARAVEKLEGARIQCRPLPVSCGFHSPLVARARDRLSGILAEAEFRPPQAPVYSNAAAAPYPDDPEAVRALLAEHLVSPVRFAGEVEAMYQAGARTFVEVGPRNVLTGLAGQVLGDRPHLAVACDLPGRPGLVQLQHALGQLFVQRGGLNLDRLFAGRDLRRQKLDALEREAAEKPLSPTTWMVDGSRARPLQGGAQSARRGAAHSAPQNAKQTGLRGVPQGAEQAAAPEILPMTGATPRPAAPQPGNGTPVQGAIPPAPATPAPEKAPVGKAAPRPMPGNGDDERIMLQFQELMSQFLETQQQVMLAYLNGGGPPPPAANGSQPAATPLAAPTPSVEPGPAPAPGPGAPEAPQAPKPPETETPLPAQGGLADAAPTGRLDPGDRRQIAQKLCEIVSERTGYPPEMLDLDLNMESDLGIDSIKRVEIVGAFQRLYLAGNPQAVQAAMEKLTAVKTLGGIVDLIGEVLQAGIQAEPPAGTSTPIPEAVPQSEPVRTDGRHILEELPRFRLEPVETPLDGGPEPSLEGKVFVITAGEGVAAEALAEEIRRRGGQAVLVRHSEAGGSAGPGGYAGDLTTLGAVERLAEEIRKTHGPPAGLIHLLPLQGWKPPEELDLAGWQAQVDGQILSLFLLAKAFGQDLRQAVREGSAWLLAATASDGDGRPLAPESGGVGGLVKTLRNEWPEVLCRAAGFPPAAAPHQIAAALLAEMGAREGEAQVFYRDGLRFALRPVPAPLDPGAGSAVQLGPESVILVTGGARGITAEAARELAEHYRPLLLIAGLSPLPEAAEPAETAGLSSPREIKEALIEGLRRSGKPVQPAQVEQAYNRLMKDREIRRNLAALENAGARVRYFQVDVRDEASLGGLIDSIYAEYGRIDGVIHGAGVIEDKLVEDKSPESFARVLHTKTDSAFLLTRKLRPESLQFFILFASIAGTFGNRGQGDYAAANEVISKLTARLDGEWPGLVRAISWGPWKKAGMVTPEVERQFAERGVQLIPPESGGRALRLEITRGSKGTAEVILGGGPWQAAIPERQPVDRTLPLLAGAEFGPGPGGKVVLRRTLDPQIDLYLQDHRIDEVPVLPAAMAMELMAEAAQQGWPDWQIAGMESFRVLKGILVEGSQKEIMIQASPEAQPDPEGRGLTVDAAITDPATGLVYYRAAVLLSDRLPAPPPCADGLPDGGEAFPLDIAGAYDNWLFHGPRWAGITAIHGISDAGMRADLRSIGPKSLLAGGSGSWVIDPVIVDSAFQLSILWARARLDMTPLPARFVRFRRFAPFPAGPLRCDFHARPQAGGHLLETDIAFLGLQGQLLGRIEGMEFNCSRALNRLAARRV